MYKTGYLIDDEIYLTAPFWSASVPIKSCSWRQAFEYALINMGFISGPKMLWRKLWL